MSTWIAEWVKREQRRLKITRATARRKMNNPIAYWAKNVRSCLVRRSKPGDTIATTAELLALATPHRCALTGWVLEPGEGTLDHITPVYDGGSHTADNLQLLHPQVNKAKGALPQDRFIAICRAIAKHNPE